MMDIMIQQLVVEGGRFRLVVAVDKDFVVADGFPSIMVSGFMLIVIHIVLLTSSPSSKGESVADVMSSAGKAGFREHPPMPCIIR